MKQAKFLVIASRKDGGHYHNLAVIENYTFTYNHSLGAYSTKRFTDWMYREKKLVRTEYFLTCWDKRSKKRYQLSNHLEFIYVGE